VVWVNYPSSLPGPQPGSFSPPARLAASSLDGPLQLRARHRDMAGKRSRYTYTYTAEQMDLWRSWFGGALLHGRRWFRAALPGNGGLVVREARYVSVQESLLGAGVYRVTAELEERGAYALVEPLTPDPLWALVVLQIQGGELVDQSSYARTLTGAGVTQFYDAWQPLSRPVIRIQGTLSFPSPTPGFVTWNPAAELEWEDNDWTVEFRVRCDLPLTNIVHWYTDRGGAGGDPLGIRTTTNLYTNETNRGVLADSLGDQTATFESSDGVYVVVERMGDVVAASINGTFAPQDVDLGSGYTFDSVFSSTNTPRIGMPSSTNANMDILVSQYRITMGAARYSHTNHAVPDVYSTG
jgi:hypothetical protein